MYAFEGKRNREKIRPGFCKNPRRAREQVLERDAHRNARLGHRTRSARVGQDEGAAAKARRDAERPLGEVRNARRRELRRAPTVPARLVSGRVVVRARRRLAERLVRVRERHELRRRHKPLRLACGPESIERQRTYSRVPGTNAAYIPLEILFSGRRIASRRQLVRVQSRGARAVRPFDLAEGRVAQHAQHRVQLDLVLHRRRSAARRDKGECPAHSETKDPLEFHTLSVSMSSFFEERESPHSLSRQDAYLANLSTFFLKALKKRVAGAETRPRTSPHSTADHVALRPAAILTVFCRGNVQQQSRSNASFRVTAEPAPF